MNRYTIDMTYVQVTISMILLRIGIVHQDVEFVDAYVEQHKWNELRNNRTSWDEKTKNSVALRASYER